MTAKRFLAPLQITQKKRCGGNPFYITAIIKRAGKQEQALLTEGDLNKILAIDLSSGFIWSELNAQVTY